MKTSLTGRQMIERFEGCILHAYRDSTGTWTIGYGHTTAAGAPAVHAGMAVTKEEADAILSADLAAVEDSVQRLIHVPLTQPEFDALVSFQFNTGWLGHPRCSLAAALNNGNYKLAAEDFALYDRAGGKILTGLVTRRAAERALFLTSKYPGTARAKKMDDLSQAAPAQADIDPAVSDILAAFFNKSKIAGYVRAGVAAGFGALIARWPWLSQFVDPATQTAIGTAAAGIVVGIWSHFVKSQ